MYKALTRVVQLWTMIEFYIVMQQVAYTPPPDTGTCGLASTPSQDRWLEWTIRRRYSNTPPPRPQGSPIETTVS